MPLLHGVLYVTIREAKDLPNKDSLLNKIRLVRHIHKDVSDPYVTVTLGYARIVKTKIIKNDLNPKWNETFIVEVAHNTDHVEVHVYDKDKIGHRHMAKCRIAVEKLIELRLIDGWFELEDDDGESIGASINFELRYRPARDENLTPEVSHCYFPMKTDCKVTLYQDAHTPESPFHKQVKLADGSTYKPANAYRDMYEAISGAKHFVLITGWSVYTKISLLRGEQDDKTTLGDLLVKKAKENVLVMAMVWNEKLSVDNIYEGMMGTHDEESQNFFKGTGVHFELVARSKEKLLHLDDPTATGKAVVNDQFISTCYSHHQKTVIVDVLANKASKRRKVVAFVGGLDLTDGRWDIPEHPLYDTILTEHKGDVYNKVVSVSEKFGPRQPWHDIHSRLEGKIALDVFKNFAERWQKQVSSKLDGKMLDLAKSIFDEDDEEIPKRAVSWNVQLFRSINCDSAKFDKVAYVTLRERKGRGFDDSIHRAYVHQIRRAENYLYIENQYFLGSSHAWTPAMDIAEHLIPLEITNRIREKINAGERFAVYVIIPMFPEGDPASCAVQEILRWQTKTIEMMYKKVAGAIKTKGIMAHPTDYLNFYCLGKREVGVHVDLPTPKAGTVEDSQRKQLRFMIYVHSKMMIVDDEYIIVGSANINQRSMKGTRDTEIAMGAYQPEHTMSKKGLPKSQVHGFRMSLWAEHMATVDPTFKNPGSLDCVRKVNDLAMQNWGLYTTDKPVRMDGHLLKYPIEVSTDGSIKAVPNDGCFPDTSARVLGAKKTVLPVKLTT